jgi:hypothetical protein
LSQRLLAEAGILLGTALNYEVWLKNIARLMVPNLADWCAIDLGTADGSVQRLAVLHVDPAKIAGVDPPAVSAAPQDRSGIYEVLRTGQSQFVSDITDEMLEASIRSGAIALARQLGPEIGHDRADRHARSHAGCDDSRLGGIRRRYSRDDLALAEGRAAARNGPGQCEAI